MDGLALRFFKNQFLVCCCYFFLVVGFCFSRCCGFGQNSEAFIFFGCYGLVLFFVSCFHFIPQVTVLLFLVASFGGQFGFTLFLQTVFKIIPGFAVFAFYCRSFRQTMWLYFLLTVFLLRHSNSFLCKQFLVFQTPFAFQFVAL